MDYITVYGLQICDGYYIIINKNEGSIKYI